MTRQKVSHIFTRGVWILHTVILAVLVSSAAPSAQESRSLVIASSGDARLSGVAAAESLLRSRLLDAAPPAIPDDPPRDEPAPDPLGWDGFPGPLDAAHTAHLLNRTLIGFRFEEIEPLRVLGPERAVEKLLEAAPLPAPPGAWVDEPIPDFRTLTEAQRDSVLRVYIERRRELRAWWLNIILEEQQGVTETLVHFWHDHFATQLSTVFIPQSMYRQNDLLRRHAMGNFRELTREIAKDPAMLIYLDGNRNTVGNPNENFARELLELFTMGEGSGYSQQDVVETARACTGWVTDGLDPYFVSWRHDYGVKTILGRTGNWGVDDVVDIIFEQEATAEFLCAKLYRWFVDDNPAPEDIAFLAAVLRESDYEVKPVLEVMLRSRHFLDTSRFRGSILRDGLDIYAGQVRRFHVENFEVTPEPTNIPARWIEAQMELYGHILFEPPNVAGWPGHHAWINTSTLPTRKLFSLSLADGVYGRTPLGFQIDEVAEAYRFRNPNDPFKLVDDLALLCFGRPPSNTVRERMLEELLQGAEPYDWAIFLPDAPQRLADLFRFVMQLPDYQLK